MNDSVSNLIINIKNAGLANKDFAIIPYSKLEFAIASLLKKEGYITSVDKKGKKTKKTLEMGIAYKNNKPLINDVKRVSKLSKRVYAGVKDIQSVKRGYGSLILSTPKGILTGKQARKEQVGGEILFKIW